MKIKDNMHLNVKEDNGVQIAFLTINIYPRMSTSRQWHLRVVKNNYYHDNFPELKICQTSDKSVGADNDIMKKKMIDYYYYTNDLYLCFKL